MIRDITIGQYYPAESLIHKLDPRTKAGRNCWIYCICVFISHLSRICSSNFVSGRNDSVFQGSGEIYFQGTENHLYAASDYHIF